MAVKSNEHSNQSKLVLTHLSLCCNISPLLLFFLVFSPQSLHCPFFNSNTLVTCHHVAPPILCQIDSEISSLAVAYYPSREFSFFVRPSQAHNPKSWPPPTNRPLFSSSVPALSVFLKATHTPRLSMLHEQNRSHPPTSIAPCFSPTSSSEWLLPCKLPEPCSVIPTATKIRSLPPTVRTEPLVIHFGKESRQLPKPPCFGGESRCDKFCPIRLFKSFRQTPTSPLLPRQGSQPIDFQDHPFEKRTPVRCLPFPTGAEYNSLYSLFFTSALH